MQFVTDMFAESIPTHYMRQRLQHVQNTMFEGYELTPVQEVYMRLTRDFRHELDNEWLENASLDAGLDGPDNLMYILANRVGSLNIWRPADRVIDDYSINLLWVNYMPQDRHADDAQHIFGDGLSNDTLNKFIIRLTEWRRLNPDAEINLWFDSALVTENAYLNTKSILDDIDVNLRDIRVLPNVPKMIQRSLHPITQIYYRVDILKILIGDYLFNESKRYAVITDVDVVPMDVDRLFDYATLHMLDKYGYVFTNSGLGSFENSFFIFDTTHLDVKDIHRQYMIDDVERDFNDMINTWTDKVYNYDNVFNKYPDFQKAIGESRRSDMPRKPVDVPESQFNFGMYSLNDLDFRSEQFRFTPRLVNIPLITRGERLEMDWLREFVPEPLDIS